MHYTNLRKPIVTISDAREAGSYHKVPYQGNMAVSNLPDQASAEAEVDKAPKQIRNAKWGIPSQIHM